MTTVKNCAWCGAEFTPTHGNILYHTVECEEAARLDRQKKRRDPIAYLIAILMKNHEIVAKLFAEGIRETSKKILEAYGFDISICRFMQPPPEFKGMVMLEISTDYFLITEKYFSNFKIYKHEKSTNESE